MCKQKDGDASVSEKKYNCEREKTGKLSRKINGTKITTSTPGRQTQTEKRRGKR